MTTALPEDSREWPTDPYLLLGLVPGCNQRELRLAYVSLIRRFPPEQFPLEFQQVRRAYESLRKDEADDQSGEGFLSRLYSREHEPSGAVRRPETIELHAICAATDDWQQRYDQLCLWRIRYGTSESVFIRLFWMLWMTPRLDSQRHPCDWLIEGMRLEANPEQCWDLYLKYLEVHPDEVFSTRSQWLLDHLPVTPLTFYCRQRWRYLFTHGLAELLLGDLEELECRFVPACETEVWMHFLFTAEKFVLWCEGAASLLDRLDELAQGYSETQLPLEGLWDERERQLFLR